MSAVNCSTAVTRPSRTRVHHLADLDPRERRAAFWTRSNQSEFNEMLYSSFRLFPCGRISKTRLDGCRMTRHLVKPRGPTVCLARWPQGDSKGDHKPSFYNPGKVDTQYKVTER